MKYHKKYIDLFLYAFVIVSVVFLIKYLKSHNLLYLPMKIELGYVVISLAFLILGFCFNCLCWRTILSNNGIRVSFKDSAESIGLSIFGKYIPGKLWLITGMSGKIARVTGASVSQIALISTLMQVLIIVIGGVVGLVSLISVIGISLVITVYIAVIFCSLLFFIFRLRLIRLASNSKKRFVIIWVKPFLESISFYLVISIFLVWLSWSAGFYFLALCFLPELSNPLLGFCFSFAASIGILVIFAPGGLGVREGLLGLLLSGFVENSNDIATLSTFSRLWFLVGEIFVFVTATIMIIITGVRRKQRIK